MIAFARRVAARVAASHGEMKPGRRRFFGAIAASPLAARQAAESAAKQLAGIGSLSGGVPISDLRDMVREMPHSGLGAQGEASANTCTQSPAKDWQVLRQLKDDIIRRALNTKQSRQELEALLYQDMRNVYSFDHDLASNRSMSLAAKVCFQRQRNVQREIDYMMLDQSLRTRIRDWKNRILSIAGIKL